MKEIIWAIFCYLLGSFPQGYFVAKKKGVDILKVGWQKTSGTNVMKNVGFFEGVLVALVDVVKGVISVLGAQMMSFSSEIQALCGIFCVLGQMWPIFLKFRGGRGGGVSIGVMLFLNLKITLVAFLFWIITKNILGKYDGAPGMLVFFGMAITLSEIGGAFHYFVSHVLPFILLQRILGPWGSLRKIKDKRILLFRLIFDRDTLKK